MMIIEHLHPNEFRYVSVPLVGLEHSKTPLEYVNEALGTTEEEIPGLLAHRLGDTSKIGPTEVPIRGFYDMWNYMYAQQYFDGPNEIAIRESPKIQTMKQRMLSRPEFSDAGETFLPDEINVVIHVRLSNSLFTPGNNSPAYYVRAIHEIRKRAPPGKVVRFRMEIEEPDWHGIAAIEEAVGYKMNHSRDVNDVLRALGRMIRADAVIASNSSLSFLCMWLIPVTCVPHVVPHQLKQCSLRGKWTRSWCDQGKLLAL